MQPTQQPASAPQPIQNVLEPIAAALVSLDYTPRDMVWNAALRLFQAPQLAQDMVDYVYAGRPAPDYERQAPPSLFRPLPGGYTVATLMRDYQFEAVGAFLMGAELTYNTAAAQKMLNKFIEEGYRKTLPDGTRVLVTLPIAERYPLCPNCALRWTQSYETCPRCGYGPEERMIDAGQIPPRILQTLSAPPAAAAAAAAASAPHFCKQCGQALSPGAHFCNKCGKAV